MEKVTPTHRRLYPLRAGWVDTTADLGAAKELTQQRIEPQFLCCTACSLVSVMDYAMPATI